MKNKISILIICLTALSLISVGQTNPTPFDLSSGNYSFTSWDSLAPAGTYPSNMIFHFINSSTLAGYDSSAVGNSDWDCAYNRRTRNRIIGLVDDGFAFIATSSGQYSDCNTVVGNDSAFRFVGAAVIGLNTIGRSQVMVSWKSSTLVRGTGTPPRQFSIRLQYRIGTSGNFSDVPGPVEYLSDSVVGIVQTIGPAMLPVSCEDQSNVQVRLLYFQHYANAGGTRPEINVDDISVSSSALTGIQENNFNKSISVYPNPASSSFTISINKQGKKNIIIYDNIGSKVMEISSSEKNIEVKRKGLENGIYYVEVRDENELLISKSKLILN